MHQCCLFFFPSSSPLWLCRSQSSLARHLQSFMCLWNSVLVSGDLPACEFYPANLVLMGGGKGKDRGIRFGWTRNWNEDCFPRGRSFETQSCAPLLLPWREEGLKSYRGANHVEVAHLAFWTLAKVVGRSSTCLWGFGWTLGH